MVAEPEAMPRAMPVAEPIDAIAVLLLVHVPPGVPELRGVVAPIHTPAEPVIGAGPEETVTLRMA
jgi:hypothetical protein